MIRTIQTYLLIVIAALSTISAQNLDSLFNEYIRVRSPELGPSIGVEVSGSEGEKCGFGLSASVRTNFDNFNPEQQNILIKLFERPVKDTSFISPREIFRIHYDLSGDAEPQYDVNLFAEALDSSYNYEVNILGYPHHPSDNGAGGDELYDVYIESLGSGLYGFTEPEKHLGGGTWISYMVVNSSYRTHYSKGINAARVTAAHEYHHAIQIGNYIYRYSDRYYHELTSTSMEEFVFDSVNDYYGYLDSYFMNPHYSFPRNNGYNIAIWNIYLRERFESEAPGLGFDIIKRSWELMKNNRAIVAIAKAVQDHGYSFKSEFNNFSLWTYFTSYRWKEDRYFSEGSNYPLIRPIKKLSFIPPKTTWSINSESVSNNLFVFADSSQGFNDTLVSIISNSDIESATSSPPGKLSLTYELFSSESEGAVKINDYYYSKITSDNNDYLFESNIFNNEPAGQTKPREEIEFVYPQPFKYSENINMYIPVKPDPSGQADLNIYTVSMDLVYSGIKNIIATDKIVVQWNGKDENNNLLPTGVYLFITKAGDNVKKGKLVIYNE